MNEEIKRLLLLYAIADEGPIGRYALKGILNLPEGVTRGLLSSLSTQNLLLTSKAGCKLSEKGENALHAWLTRYGVLTIKELDVGQLKIANAHMAIHVRGRKPKSILEGRDLAVRAGAKGAILLTFLNGVLSVPMVYPDLSREFPEVAKTLLNVFNLKNGDLVIVCGASDRWRALEGALAVTASLE
jgi:hypothetical protein